VFGDGHPFVKLGFLLFLFGFRFFRGSLVGVVFISGLGGGGFSPNFCKGIVFFLLFVGGAGGGGLYFRLMAYFVSFYLHSGCFMICGGGGDVLFLLFNVFYVGVVFLFGGLVLFGVDFSCHNIYGNDLSWLVGWGGGLGIVFLVTFRSMWGLYFGFV